MLKKGMEGGLLQAMRHWKRAEAAGEAGGGPTGPAGKTENTEEAETRPAGPAAAVGERLIQNLAASLGVSLEEAAELLLGAQPDGLRGLSARAAGELSRLKKDDALAGEPEDYAEDEIFLALLRELPPAAALRVRAAQKSLEEAQAALATAREDGARDLMEKLAARKVLPATLKNAASTAPQADFSAMSSAEFGALKAKLRRAALEKRGAN